MNYEKIEKLMSKRVLFKSEQSLFEGEVCEISPSKKYAKFAEKFYENIDPFCEWQEISKIEFVEELLPLKKPRRRRWWL